MSQSHSRSEGPRGRQRRAKSCERGIPHVLLMIETSLSFGREAIAGIVRYAEENGPWSIQFEDRGMDSLPPKWLKEWHGSGIITRTMTVNQARVLRATELPMVELFGDPKFGTAQVQCDDDAISRMAVDHFLDCGLRHFAYFTYTETWRSDAHRTAFRRAVEAKGYKCHDFRPSRDSRHASRPVWHESQRPSVLQWLHGLPRPIGVYTLGDRTAVRLLEICREANIAVPEEIAVLGNGNDPVLCETIRPTLSSIDIDSRRVGYEAARLLDRLMAGEAPPKNVIYTPPDYVVIRQSTDALAIEDADVAKALRFIRENACSHIDVARVAEEVGLSRSVLQRRFRQHSRHTPKEEIMRIRIARAKTLLAKSDKSGEAIAHQSGFSSLKYFTKAFRREVGMTPEAYRRMRRVSRD